MGIADAPAIAPARSILAALWVTIGPPYVWLGYPAPLAFYPDPVRQI